MNMWSCVHHFLFYFSNLNSEQHTGEYSLNESFNSNGFKLYALVLYSLVHLDLFTVIDSDVDDKKRDLYKFKSVKESTVASVKWWKCNINFFVKSTKHAQMFFRQNKYYILYCRLSYMNSADLVVGIKRAWRKRILNYRNILMILFKNESWQPKHTSATIMLRHIKAENNWEKEQYKAYMCVAHVLLRTGNHTVQSSWQYHQIKCTCTYQVTLRTSLVSKSESFTVFNYGIQQKKTFGLV